MQCRRQRPGFNRAELLVVIVIVAALIALLIPAVQKVRDGDGNVMTCRNQLKQIGLAFHNHHDIFGVMPSGGGAPESNHRRVMVGDTPADYNYQTWGWAYQILPFLEQADLWAGNELEAAAAPVSIYICPSFRGPMIRPYRENGKSDQTLRAMMDYDANGGSWGAGNLAEGFNAMDGAVVPTRYQAPPPPAGQQPKILSGLVRKLADITDGTAQTILVGEKYVDPTFAYDPNATSSCNDDQGYVDGWDNDAIVFARGDNSRANSRIQPPVQNFIENPQATHGGSKGAICGAFFGSIHAQMNTLFCDGSIRAIGFDIDPQVFAWLCSCNDGIDANFQE